MKFYRYIVCAFLFIGAAIAETININWINDNETYAQTTCEIGGDVILPTTPTKRGYTFAGWLTEYTRLEYIESTGTQYIDTGIHMELSTDILSFTGIVANNTTVSSRRNFIASINNYQNSHYIEFTDNYFGQKPGGMSWDIKLPNKELNINQPYEVGLQINGGTSTKCSIVVDGVKYEQTTTSHQGLDVTHNFVLGQLDARFSQIKFYTSNLILNDVVVRDFIPAKRNSDGAVGMYDTVTGQFFTTAGTREFIAGPVAENQNFYE